MRIAVIVIAVLALAACASANEEWTGDGSEAFGSADTYCMRQSFTMAHNLRDSAYTACMAQRGWTQPIPAQ